MYEFDEICPECDGDGCLFPCDRYNEDDHDLTCDTKADLEVYGE